MNAKHVLAGTVLLAMVACGGGGSDTGTAPTNEPPTLSFQTAAIAVPKSSQTNLTVSASDPDNDALTITWQITRGTLSSQNSANTVMRWTAPSSAGADTVLITANDGTESTTLSVVMKVGTRITTTSLQAPMTKANSPYILAPSGGLPAMNVPANITTTIDAGVELLIDIEDMHINVLGELQANGTVDEPIVIRPNDRTFKCTSDQGWWEGFRGATDDAEFSDGFINFSHVEVRDAKWGVRLSDNASALLQDCRIVCSSIAGVLVEGNGSLRALDSRISDGMGDGILIYALSSLPDSVRISGCNLSFNGNAGIHMDLNDVDQVVPIIVDHNQIEFNASYGIELSNSVFPSIHYNAFRGNGESSVASLYLTSGYPDPVILPNLDATCNFWGSATTSQATIDASIRDSLDTSTVHTRVISCPWLNSTPIGASPACTCPP